MCSGGPAPKSRRPSRSSMGRGCADWSPDALEGHRDLLNRPLAGPLAGHREMRPTPASLKDQRSLAIDRIVKDGVDRPEGPTPEAGVTRPEGLDHSGHEEYVTNPESVRNHSVKSATTSPTRSVSRLRVVLVVGEGYITGTPTVSQQPARFFLFFMVSKGSPCGFTRPVRLCTFRPSPCPCSSTIRSLG